MHGAKASQYVKNWMFSGERHHVTQFFLNVNFPPKYSLIAFTVSVLESL